MFQTLTMPGDTVYPDTRDHPITERQPLLDEGWPKMAFIEHRFAGDPTNWWVPNHAGCEAMLRAAGLKITRRPAGEIYLCEPDAGSPARRWASNDLVASAVGAVQSVGSAESTG
jgi:tRNA (mo5U34)-methyltransferase